VPERASDSDLVPVGLYLWTWAGGIIANVFFLGRPAVGIIGGMAMGLVAVPLAMRLSRR
jgi:putative membrane protein